MSNYTKPTKHPITKEWKMADWIDDFFGHHRYAVVFTLDDGKKEIFKEDDYEWETRDELYSDTNQLKEKILREIEVAKSAMHGGGNHRMVMELLIEKIKTY